MRKHFFMPKNGEAAVFHGLFTIVEGRKKAVNTYVIQYTRRGNRLREISPLGRFLRYGEPETKKEGGAENPEGFGRKGESKFVYEPMPWYCPHTAQVAAAVEASLNPRLFAPLKEETMRYIKSQARKKYVAEGGLKSSKASEIPGTVHFFEVRKKGNPNLVGIIDESGKMVCSLDIAGLTCPESEISRRAQFIGLRVREENGVCNFFKDTCLPKYNEVKEKGLYFTFGEQPSRMELFKSDFIKWFNELRTIVEIGITQAEAALRLHTLGFILREMGLQTLPAEETPMEKILGEYRGYVINRQAIPIDARDKDGERQPLEWLMKIDRLEWMPTFAEFKEAVAGLREMGVGIVGIGVDSGVRKEPVSSPPAEQAQPPLQLPQS